MSDTTRAYAKGYAAGSRGRWPPHKPPLPPDGLARRIVAAARALRDGIDGELAKFDEDDELNTVLGPLIDAFDEAMADVTDWLRNKEDAPHA